MTLEETYNLLQGDYKEAKMRLMNDKLVERFILKFLTDPSMDNLRTAVEAEDYEGAFRAVHTLKGVSANMAFTHLYNAANALTEQLRGDATYIDKDLLAKVEESYELTVKAIKDYSSQK